MKKNIYEVWKTFYFKRKKEKHSSILRSPSLFRNFRNELEKEREKKKENDVCLHVVLEGGLFFFMANKKSNQASEHIHPTLSTPSHHFISLFSFPETADGNFIDRAGKKSIVINLRSRVS